jgi:hypothetical protein
MTQVTLVAVTIVIVRCQSCFDGGRRILVCQELLGDDMVWVAASDLSQYCIAIQRASLGT